MAADPRGSAAKVTLPVDLKWPKCCGQPMWFRGGDSPVFYCDCGHRRPPEPHEVRTVDARTQRTTRTSRTRLDKR